jgi:hypothetical protein
MIVGGILLALSAAVATWCYRIGRRYGYEDGIRAAGRIVFTRSRP